jgi:hypothetical protein
MRHDSASHLVPPEPGDLPTEHEPDPAPERDELRPTGAGEQTELGQPVGPDNIAEGRVGGVMGTPMGQHGQGQGG